MKIAISGKGGVGKTTLCALLARELSEQGKRVLAIDADPNGNLAEAVGYDEEAAGRIEPLIEKKKHCRGTDWNQAREYGGLLCP